MPWFKVDDQFHGHPKVAECNLEAIGLWTILGTWSAQFLTDGFISAAVFRRYGGTPEIAQALLSAELWSEEEDGWQFNDWNVYQPTKESVEKKREEARDRMAKVRATKGVAPDIEFEKFYKQYPRKVARPKAKLAYAKALTKATPEQIMAGLARWKGAWTDKAFIPYPATWLNGECWNDDTPTEPLPKQTQAAKNLSVVDYFDQMERQQQDDGDDPDAMREITR